MPQRRSYNGVSVQALRPLGAFLAAAALVAVAPPSPLTGFTAASSARERVDEARFLDLPSAQGALDHAAVIGAHPHYAGTVRCYMAGHEKVTHPHP